MIDSGPQSGTPAALTAPAYAPQRVEERLRRLEDAVAALQEQRRPEPPVILAAPEPPQPLPPAAASILETGRRLLPLAVSLLPPVPEAAPAAPGPDGTGQRRRWLLLDAIDELRLIVAMFSDRRYRVSWIAWVVPLCFMFLMIAASMIIGRIPIIGSNSTLSIIGSALEKLADLVLAFFIFKVLVREANRYRESLFPFRNESRSASA